MLEVGERACDRLSLQTGCSYWGWIGSGACKSGLDCCVNEVEHTLRSGLGTTIDEMTAENDMPLLGPLARKAEIDCNPVASLCLSTIPSRGFLHSFRIHCRHIHSDHVKMKTLHTCGIACLAIVDELPGS